MGHHEIFVIFDEVHISLLANTAFRGNLLWKVLLGKKKKDSGVESCRKSGCLRDTEGAQ